MGDLNIQIAWLFELQAGTTHMIHSLTKTSTRSHKLSLFSRSLFDPLCQMMDDDAYVYSPQQRSISVT